MFRICMAKEAQTLDIQSRRKSLLDKDSNNLLSRKLAAHLWSLGIKNMQVLNELFTRTFQILKNELRGCYGESPYTFSIAMLLAIIGF